MKNVFFHWNRNAAAVRGAASRALRRLLCCALCGCAAAALYAADYTWIGPGGGNWNSAGNWKSNTGTAVPGSGDTARFTSSTGVTIAADTDIEAAVVITDAGVLFDCGGNNISFSGEITCSGTYGGSLTVRCDGVVSFGADIGSESQPLASLTVTHSNNNGGEVQFTGGKRAVYTSGAQQWGHIMLGESESSPADLTLSADGDIVFTGAVSGGGSLTVQCDGVVSFDADIGSKSQPLASLTVTHSDNDGGEVRFTGGKRAVYTSGAQQWGHIMLGESGNSPADLTLSADGDIVFTGAVSGGGSLTVWCDGVVSFGADIGPLASLTVTHSDDNGGEVRFTGGDRAVYTSGDQQWGHIMLGESESSPADLTLSADGDIVIYNNGTGSDTDGQRESIDGWGSVEISAQTAKIYGAVGWQATEEYTAGTRVGPPSSLTINAPVTFCHQGGNTVYTKGSQTYGSTVTVTVTGTDGTAQGMIFRNDGKDGNDGGSFAFGGAVDITGDLVIIGGAYNADDNASGVSGLLRYNSPLRTDANHYAKPRISGADKGIRNSTGTASAVTGGSITVSGNFYVNGADLSGITLHLGDTDNSRVRWAEAHNADIMNCTAEGGTVAADGCEDHGNNSGWAFARPELHAETVADNVIRVWLTSDGNPVHIENSSGEIARAVEHIGLADDDGASFEVFADKACTQPLPVGDCDEFFLQASRTWNTDANGTDAGTHESTDASGAHQNIRAALTVPRALDGVFAVLRDEHKNRTAHYVADNLFTDTEDCCAPALTAVRTGQEAHTAGGAANQELYDAHNFIEFRYSEPVLIDGKAASKDYLPASDAYGGITAPAGGGLEIAGLARITGGALKAGRQDGERAQAADAGIHSVYRYFSVNPKDSPLEQPCRVRVGIAAYRGSTAEEFAGFIDEAETPRGTAEPLAGNIKILDMERNELSVTGGAEAAVNSTAERGTVYGPWDTSPPVFARISGGGSTDTLEIAAINADMNAAGMADRMELHWFDNMPAAGDSWQWVSKTGWVLDGGQSGSLSETRFPDTRGGNRPDEDTARSSGGIRSGTVEAEAFMFRPVDEEAAAWTFSAVENGVSLDYFFGKDTALAVKADADSLYRTLIIEDGARGRYPVKTMFTVWYERTEIGGTGTGFVTDLAGNRMRTMQEGDYTTIDVVPPRMLFSAAPLENSRTQAAAELFVLFSEQVHTDSSLLSRLTGGDGHFEVRLDDARTGTPLDIIDASRPAELRGDTEFGTALVLPLTRALTFDELRRAFLVLPAKSEKERDPITGTDTSVTLIKDGMGNSAADDAHAVSDCIIGGADAVFAVGISSGGGLSAEALAGETYPFGQNVFGSDGYGVRDFALNAGSSGTLLSGYDCLLQCGFFSGDGADQIAGMKMYIAGSTDTAGPLVRRTGIESRVWFPDSTQTHDAAFPLSAVAAGNGNYRQPPEPEGARNGTVPLFTFTVPVSSAYGWSAGDELSFVLAPTDGSGAFFTNADGAPLFAFRLEDASDIASFNPWFLRVSDVTRQRGGVTVLNNVINRSAGEQTVIELEMPASGTVTVQVLTLDGNVVRTLHKGRVSAGTQYYRWDGTNAGGRSVARGMYFVRVYGSGIDETRKVLVTGFQ